ncbi:MAG: PLP-dependent aminotransferase family protein [Actinomycetota bacterium]|nr:PLP-dependent aminotransferase family protein [Actinomycetota bacterium]
MERLGVRSLYLALGDWQSAPGGSLATRMASALREAIETSVLSSGTVLPAERSMARDLGVSRSTVTAALQLLKADGYLEARHGSGTIVTAGMVPGSEPRRDRSVIDLAESSPGDARALPVVGIDLEALLRSGSASGYTPAGLPSLRRSVADRFTADGLPTDPSQIVITNGAQHALALCFAQFAEPGDCVLLDEPTYPGLIDLLEARGLVPIAVPRHSGAIDGGLLRTLAESSGATLAYLQTLVHNPTGLTGDDDALDRLADSIGDLSLTVVEDVVLADLRFDHRRPSPLAARMMGSSAAGTAAQVIVVGSVSKLGWGGLRIGWLRADVEQVDQMLRSRRADDLGSSIPSQVISTAVLAEFSVLAESRQRTLSRRAALACQFLETSFPTWRFTPPNGGLSIWVELPSSHAAGAVVEAAAAAGVLIATGASSSVTTSGAQHIRICFDRPEPQLREGLQRLARAVDQMTDRWSTVNPS